MGISQTTGHMSVFFSFLQKLSQLGRTVGVYYILYFNRVLINNKQLLTETFSYILKKRAFLDFTVYVYTIKMSLTLLKLATQSIV